MMSSLSSGTMVSICWPGETFGPSWTERRRTIPLTGPTTVRLPPPLVVVGGKFLSPGVMACRTQCKSPWRILDHDARWWYFAFHEIGFKIANPVGAGIAVTVHVVPEVAWAPVLQRQSRSGY